MEVTAAERTTIYTNISPLAQRVNNYIQTQHSYKVPERDGKIRL